MAVAEMLHSFTFEEYWALESDMGAKHELIEGQLYAMSGGSLRHATVIGRILRAVGDAADAEGCRPYASDALVKAAGDWYYPDVMVACGDPPDDRYEDSPCLLVEVGSPSTVRTDRREKRDAYLKIPTLLTYILADPDGDVWQVYQRIGGAWQSSILSVTDHLTLECPTVTLDIGAIHRR